MRGDNDRDNDRVRRVFFSWFWRKGLGCDSGIENEVGLGGEGVECFF